MSRNIRQEIDFTTELCQNSLQFLHETIQGNDALHNYSASINQLKQKVDTMSGGGYDQVHLVKINHIFWEIFEKSREIIRFYLAAGNYSRLVTPEIYKFMASRLFKLKKTDAWRGKMKKTDGFKKEEKEALQAMVYTMLAVYRQEVEGKTFNKSAAIGYFMMRILKKSYTWDAKPYNKKALRDAVHNYDFYEMLYVIKESVRETNLLFISAIYDLADQFTDEDKKLFETTKAVVNQVEFNQIKDSIFLEEQDLTRNQVVSEWDRYGADKYVPNKLEALLERISWGRNTVRWQGYAYVLDCNILAHMLETAVFGWLMALEENDTQKAERAFFVGLFHDLAELWTDDIPSPCKDSIHDGSGCNIREITGDLERDALEEMFYTKLHPAVAAYFRQNIIFEDIQDKDFYRFMKKADYFSADYELWWNFCEGSKETRFREIINDSATLNRTPATQKVVEYMRDAIAPLVLLTP